MSPATAGDPAEAIAPMESTTHGSTDVPLPMRGDPAPGQGTTALAMPAGTCSNGPAGPKAQLHGEGRTHWRSSVQRHATNAGDR